MAYLYALTFANGKQYIGITINPVSYRFRQHKTSFRSGSTRAVYSAWKKHGEPSMQVLAEIEEKDLAATEMRAIATFMTMPPYGYNTTIGGDVSPMTNPDVVKKATISRKNGAGYGQTVGKKMSAEVRSAASKRMLGKKLSPETKAKVVASIRARALIPQSQETIEKRKASILVWRNSPEGIAIMQESYARRVGRKQTQHARDVASATHKGKILSEETKAKVSESQKKRLANPEIRAILADAARKFHTGKKRSEKAKANMALAQQRRRQRERAV